MSINLKLPAFDDNPILLAETRPSKVNVIINNLPFSDPIMAATDLAEELQILNSQKIAYTNRVNALELYRPAAIKIHQSLIPNFSSASLPTSKNALTFARAAELLWQEIAYGYKLALVDLQNKIVNVSLDKSTALTVQRAIHALKEIIFINYLIYRTPSSLLWTELHQLYYSALQRNAHELSVSESLPNTNESTVNTIYTQALLLALANPQRLSNQNIVKTDAYLTNISSSAELRSLGLIDDFSGVFLVQLNGSKPPTSYAKTRSAPNNETDILLVTIKLAKRIHTHLKLLQDNIVPNDGTLPNNAISTDYKDLLVHLINHFGKSPLRQFSRSKKNDGLELGIGINDAHYFVPKSGNNFKQLVVQNAPIKPSRWQVLNISAKGTALRKFNSSQVTMHVGDVATIRNNETLIWEVAIVRWANVNELNQLDAGFELISPSAKAILVTSDQNTAKFKALLLPQLDVLKQRASIIVPRHEFSLGQVLTIIEHDVETNILTKKLIERTATIERYQYSLL